MSPTTKKVQPPMGKRWILIIFMLIVLLLTANWINPALNSYAATQGSLLVAPGHTPTATATATSTSQRPATQTTTPLSPQEALIKVSGTSADLRTGPDLNLSIIRMLPNGAPLMLLGRLSDNSWFYVKTSNGVKGWINSEWVDLTGINIDQHAIQTPTPPKTTAKVSGTTVNLRAGPKDNFSKIQKLTYGETLVLLGRLSDNSWFFVKTTDGTDGWIRTEWVELAGRDMEYGYYPIKTSPPTETATPVVLEGVEGRWIDVDLSEQKLFAYEGTTLKNSFLVSTGVDKYPTETGQYHIQVKFRYTDMHGPDYFLPDVPFSMYYSGDFSIHGTYWHHNFGTTMSHGCVNVSISNAEWLYNWASVGTLVNIHR